MIFWPAKILCVQQNAPCVDVHVTCEAIPLAELMHDPVSVHFSMTLGCWALGHNDKAIIY